MKEKQDREKVFLIEATLYLIFDQHFDRTPLCYFRYKRRGVLWDESLERK
jgi:hypothetical protein